MSTENNKALVRRFFQEFWEQKKLAVLDEIMATHHVDHTPGSPAGLPPGPEGYRQFASVFFAAFPDLGFTIEEMVAEADEVVTRWSSHATHSGTFIGIPPTGKSTSVTGITISRIGDNTLVETWTNFDMLGLLQQIGAIPAPG